MQIVISLFLLLEFFNVIALYFNPGDTKANAMGAFKLWEESTTDREVHLLLKYMANWVAGTKLIFIFLLIVLLLFGDAKIQFYGLIALVLAILTYFWKLAPLIREMDEKGMIQPQGYSKTLTLMITAFVILLSLAGIIDYFIL